MLGMFVIFSALGLVISMETYYGSNFRVDRDLLITLLQRARAQAINNICDGVCDNGVPHGVFIDDVRSRYVLFQGGAYEPSEPMNSVFEADPSIYRSGVRTVVFSQLTGTTSEAVTIRLKSRDKSSDISISPTGRIDWSN